VVSQRKFWPLATGHRPLTTTTPTPLHALIVRAIQQHGPLTVAAFMELALYHPDHGYYLSRAQRSGRAGDFYTSVDAGPLFGEVLADQLGEMLALVGERIESAEEAKDAEAQRHGSAALDLVEAAAGNGRLTRDVLDALQREWPVEYGALRVHLVERSEAARARQAETLGPHATRLASRGAQLPARITGVIVANELLDAMPVHVVAMTARGAREIYVDCDGDRLVEREGPISTPALLPFLDLPGAPMLPGTRAEIGLAAAGWIRDAASRLSRGFVLLFDYGDTAPRLRSLGRPEGTLRAFREHRVSARWIDHPGEQDLTAHVDFTALDRAAQAAGLDALGRVDQAKFLLGLGAVERLEAGEATQPQMAALRRRLAAKTLLAPGGIGSTHQAIVFGKNMGSPSLAGLSLLRR
jgi:SAM-dependent MidA family methyltransferase